MAEPNGPTVATTHRSRSWRKVTHSPFVWSLLVGLLPGLSAGALFVFAAIPWLFVCGGAAVCWVLYFTGNRARVTLDWACGLTVAAVLDPFVAFASIAIFLQMGWANIGG